MSTVAEGYHHVDGPEPIDLYKKTWTPTRELKAKLIFVHGFSDHVNRYYELFPTLASRGIECIGFDQRGWGRSVKKHAQKGRTGPTSVVIADIVSVIRSQLPSPVPVFVMGHSMGGGEVMTLACDPAYGELMPSVRGWLAEAALFGFSPAVAPNPLVVFFGRLAGRWLPKQHMVQKVVPEIISRDPEVVRAIDEDELCHDTGTLEGLASMLDRTLALASGTMKVNKGVQSIWISHGSGDQCTSYDASKKFYDLQTIEDKEFKSYEGWSHALHADLPDTRGIFAQDVGDWILARASAGTERAMKESSKL